MQEIERLAHFKAALKIIIIFYSANLFAQEFPINEVDSLLKSGIRNIINQDYSLAEKKLLQLEKDFPESPLGKIYLAACKISEAFDYAEEYDSDFIETNLDSAEEVADNLVSSDENNIWYNYYYALALGYRTYYEAITGDWLSAISDGTSSMSAFSKCLELDENFYEAYIAIGTYEYWMSRKTDFLNGIPFYEDNTEEGIEKLRTVIEKSSYNYYLAVNSLIWIYIDQGNYKKAVELGETFADEFPASRYFKWGLGRAYEDVDPLKSIKIYSEILNSFPESDKRNHINEIVLKHLLAQQYVKIGDNKRALDICKEILSIKNLTDFEVSKLGDRLERVEELKESLIR